MIFDYIFVYEEVIEVNFFCYIYIVGILLLLEENY